MNTKHNILLLMLALTSLTVSAQAPTEEQAQSALRERVQKESKGYIQVVNLNKTNGKQEQLINGEEVYTLYYDVLIEFTKDCYKACDPLNGCFYTYRDCTEQEPIGWEAYNKQIKKFKKGQQIKVTGSSMKFTKTEQGWVARKMYR